jgi:hypothetical protein
MQRHMQIVRGQVSAPARWAGLALVSASLWAGGCRSVLGIDDTDEVPDDCFPGTHAGGKGVGWWSTCNEAQACFSAGAPGRDGRPTTPDGPDVETFYLANRTTHMGTRNQAGQLDENAWKEIGFDLDGVCTLSPPCESAGQVGSCRTESVTAPVDGALCRDNQIGKLAFLFETKEGLQGFLPTDPEFNCSLCRGDYNFLLRIQGYNGTDTDPAVRVDFYPSTGLEARKDLDCTREDWDTGDPSACWTRADRWNIQRESLEKPELGTMSNSIASDASAFVRAGTLFVQMPPNTDMWYPSDAAGNRLLPLRVQEGMLTGNLRKTDAGWVLEDGLITGRTKGVDLLTSLERIGVCPGTAAHEDAEFFAGAALDVLSSGEEQPDVPCDSLSLALTLTAAEADVGVVERFPLPNDCELEPAEPAEPEPAEPAPAEIAGPAEPAAPAEPVE